MRAGGTLVGALIFLSTLAASQAGNSPADARQCVSMQDDRSVSDFKSCSVAGYNNTFPLNESITKRARGSMAYFFEWFLNRMENCSRNGMAEALFCSWFVPKCENPSQTRILPCRRVCGEFLKQCLTEMEEMYFDMIIGMCEILPNKTASSGQCLEPPGFTVNTTVPDPLLRPCQRLIFPACQGKSYTHTLLTSKAQEKLYRLFYGNYTKGNMSKEFPPYLEELFSKYPKCRLNMEKHFCSSLFPPCFPPELAAWYTLCKANCHEILVDCPELERDRRSVFWLCNSLPEGTTSHGYCKHKDWPSPDDWIGHFMDPSPSPSATPTAPRSGASPAVIAAAVLVPLLLIGSILAAMVFWKRRRLWPTGFKYGKQQDDMDPLDT